MRLHLWAAIVLAAALNVASASQSHAQGAIVPPIDGSDPHTGSVITSPNALGPSTTPSRIGARRGGTTSVSPAISPEVAAANAQNIALAAGSSCRVSSAEKLGEDPAQHAIYEATCATGPGYMLVDTTPPQAIDCVLLAGQAQLEMERRAAIPAVEGAPQQTLPVTCRLPANQNTVAVIAEYARQAGMTCPVDQALSIGKSVEGNLVYEVGCDGADGAWIEQNPTGWTRTECIEVISQGDTCRFSPAVDQAATLKARLATHATASACDVTQARYMGANANGSFYEAKCGGGNGVIVRFDSGYAVQQVYPCETAQQIGGGCKLTIPAAP